MSDASEVTVCGRWTVRRWDSYLYILTESYTDIDPRWMTHTSNVYLLLGTDKAALIDTGAGIEPIRPVIAPLFGERELLVFNTHWHYDHVGGNHEFQLAHIHKEDMWHVIKPISVKELQDSPGKAATAKYQNVDWIMCSCAEHKPLQDGDSFDLGGGLKLAVVHSPGHTQGSASFISSQGHLFVGDMCHCAAILIPDTRPRLDVYLASLEKLMEAAAPFGDDVRVFGGHDQPNSSIRGHILSDLHEAIKNHEELLTGDVQTNSGAQNPLANMSVEFSDAMQMSIYCGRCGGSDFVWATPFDGDAE